jgi:hypothetical protein
MFSTLFYFFLLFYEGLFSMSTTEYNAKISQLNQYIANQEYPQALVRAKSIWHSRLFNNPEIEEIIAILELKQREMDKSKVDRIAISSQSIDSDILKSHYSARNGHSTKGLSDLHQSIIQNGQVDTLIKAYELYAFYFPQNKLRKKASSAQIMNQTQKINTQEALSLLDLMKKKQKKARV